MTFIHRGIRDGILHNYDKLLVRFLNVPFFLGKPLTEANVLTAVKKLKLGTSDHFVDLPTTTTSSEVIVKTLGLCMGTTYAAVVLPLHHHLDLQKVGELCGIPSSDIHLVSPTELVDIFGYEPGCLGPVGLRQGSPLPVFMDKSLFEFSTLYCGAGATGRVFSVEPNRLHSVLGSTSTAFLCIS